jgi:hypothetical protein
MNAADEPATPTYSVRVRGYLDPRWAAWFDGLAITHEPDGDTTLAGPVADQAALYGLLSRARDLGLTLVSVRRHRPDGPSQPPAPGA